jgi:hypothetical protein
VDPRLIEDGRRVTRRLLDARLQLVNLGSRRGPSLEDRGAHVAYELSEEQVLVDT